VDIDFSAIQILIVLVIALLVFGPKRLPELGRQIGRGIRDLKAQVNSITEDVGSAVGRDSDRDAESSTKTPSTAAIPDAPVVDNGDVDVLDGVVVSGATGPPPKPPAET
jgi:TatA/E family protein of Tat protein translocase